MSRKNISLHSEVEKRAKDIIKARGFAGLSDLLAALIREEHERRHPPEISAVTSYPDATDQSAFAAETPEGKPPRKPKNRQKKIAAAKAQGMSDVLEKFQKPKTP
jgi:hypothetical protein